MWIGDNCFKKGCLSNNNKIHSFMNSRGENLKSHIQECNVLIREGMPCSYTDKVQTGTLGKLFVLVTTRGLPLMDFLVFLNTKGFPKCCIFSTFPYYRWGFHTAMQNRSPQRISSQRFSLYSGILQLWWEITLMGEHMLGWLEKVMCFR